MKTRFRNKIDATSEKKVESGMKSTGHLQESAMTSNGTQSQALNVQTAEVAEPMYGNKLYQQRARQVLPILVRQAYANQTIYYSDLAKELGITNARNLNFVLGSVGKTLVLLSKKMKEDIPPIQCVVVNKATGIPGVGIGWFIDKVHFAKMSKDAQTAITKVQLELVYQYAKWHKVLEELELKPLQSEWQPLVASASSLNYRGAGESEHHKKLKNFIADNPSVLDLPTSTTKGKIEFDLPSGDTLDVLFQSDKQWTAVEIKSHISSDSDLVRGFFQCVKYQAVLKAYLASLYQPKKVRTVLVIGKPLPTSLIKLQRLLGVEVYIQTSTHE